MSPDGERFLMIKRGPITTDETSTPSGIILVENWFDELKALVPVP